MTARKTVGARIVAGLEEAVAYIRGDAHGVRVRLVPLTARTARVRPAPRYDARRIAALRARLRLSQPVFARALNVSPDTVRAWEQGKRRPDGAALRLLQVADRHPAVIVEHVARRSA
jgi:putative transcriptional regulator